MEISEPTQEDQQVTLSVSHFQKVTLPVAQYNLLISYLSPEAKAELKAEFDKLSTSTSSSFSLIPLGTALLPELIRHSVNFLSPSDVLIFRRTSRLGRQISDSLLSGRIVVAAGRKAFIFNAVTARLLHVLEGHDSYIDCCKFSEDGRRLITASEDTTAKIWDTVKGTLLITLRGHVRSVNYCEFSPDGKRILTGSTTDYTVRVWNAENGTLLLVVEGHTSAVRGCAFSPDGSRIVTVGYDKKIRVWCAETGECQLTIEGEHTKMLTCCCFSHDDKYILTSSWDMTAIWNATDGTLIKTLRHKAWVTSCAFSFDDKLILTACNDGSACIWDTQSGQSKCIVKGHSEPVYGSCFCADGRRIITASRDRTARIWDAHTGKLLSEFKFTKDLAGYVDQAGYIPWYCHSCDFTPFSYVVANRTSEPSEADITQIAPMEVIQQSDTSACTASQ